MKALGFHSMDGHAARRTAGWAWWEFTIILPHGEVPKLAEGTPLERVQVVNSGARVQIPPSPFWILHHEKYLKIFRKKYWQIKNNMIEYLSWLRKDRKWLEATAKNKIKKLLTNTKDCDRIQKLLNNNKTTLTTEQWNNLERFKRVSAWTSGEVSRKQWRLAEDSREQALKDAT